MGEGREGDWECNGCKNRNYAFRSFCNRCKQPRLLVDTKTPADSKWLPRIGDWICSGIHLFTFCLSLAFHILVPDLLVPDLLVFTVYGNDFDLWVEYILLCC